MTKQRFILLRERKLPPDARVPLSPAQCAQAMRDFPLEIVAEPSPIRCFTDAEYRAAEIAVRDARREADVLLGVKEVPVDELIPGKTYCMFSHTIKKQPYNRGLLQAILERDIRLIDYEVLTDERGLRLIAFGRFAGMVGAHNALYTYARRTGAFELARMTDFRDYAEARATYRKLSLPAVKIVLTGTGRVGNGAAEVLRDMGIRQVEPEDFLEKDYAEAVFTQLGPEHYVRPRGNHPFDMQDFFDHPDRYQNAFQAYARAADIMINGIFWDKRAPAFFRREEMAEADFRIRVIADVTCDIAPESSIPATLRATTIADPIFGFDPATGSEAPPHQEQVIDMMTIDNLPSELPRDASQAFGEMFLQHVLPEFFKPESPMLERATIVRNGELGRHFQYLADYAAGNH